MLWCILFVDMTLRLQQLPTPEIRCPSHGTCIWSSCWQSFSQNLLSTQLLRQQVSRSFQYLTSSSTPLSNIQWPNLMVVWNASFVHLLDSTSSQKFWYDPLLTESIFPLTFHIISLHHQICCLVISIASAEIEL